VGKPTLRTPNGERTLREGDVVVFPTGEEGAHLVRNDGDAPVRVVMLSNLAAIEMCAYPDSDKIGAWGGDLKLMNRASANVDYWDGEER
jgi:uncharacterized cupin superfamily protein